MAITPFFAADLAGFRGDEGRFERIAEGHYVLTAPELNTDLEIKHVRRERYQLHGELTAHSGLSGTRPVNGVLFTASFNLGSLRDRETFARTLQARTATPQSEIPKWRAMLDELCIRTNDADLKGAPAVRLCDVSPRGVDQWQRVLGFALPDRLPAMIFSDGDTLKTYTSDAIAVDLARQGTGVLICDWEMTEDEHAERVRRITGGTPPDNIAYLSCTRPLVHERDRIAEAIHAYRPEFLICDSAAFACHDKPESADAALVYFREIRRFGITSLHIAHTTKGEGSDQKPFGSAFWYNSVRALWYAKRAEAGADPAIVEVGFYPRKFNKGARPNPNGLRFAFTDTTTAVEPFNLTDVESLAAGLSLRDRIKHVLHRGARSIPELAAELDAEPASIRRAVDRYASSNGKASIVLFTKVTDSTGEIRIGLAETRRSA